MHASSDNTSVGISAASSNKRAGVDIKITVAQDNEHEPELSEDCDDGYFQFNLKKEREEIKHTNDDRLIVAQISA